MGRIARGNKGREGREGTEYLSLEWREELMGEKEVQQEGRTGFGGRQVREDQQNKLCLKSFLY